MGEDEEGGQEEDGVEGEVGGEREGEGCFYWFGGCGAGDGGEDAEGCEDACWAAEAGC